MHIKIVLCLIVLVFVCQLTANRSITEPFTNEEKAALFEDLMDNYSSIFPSRNRNAGGPQWYHYIYNQRSSITRDEFIAKNQMYCGVSGSPVDPRRSGTIVRTIEVPDLDDNPVRGSYYHCCWPCLCDVMKYTRAEEFTVTLADGEYAHTVLTIPDPCQNESQIPKTVECYDCDSSRTSNGVHTSSGRLIFAVLHPEVNDNSYSETMELCEERLQTDPEDLRGGMGDIFVRLSLLG